MKTKEVLLCQIGEKYRLPFTSMEIWAIFVVKLLINCNVNVTKTLFPSTITTKLVN